MAEGNNNLIVRTNRRLTLQVMESLYMTCALHCVSLNLIHVPRTVKPDLTLERDSIVDLYLSPLECLGDYHGSFVGEPAHNPK